MFISTVAFLSLFCPLAISASTFSKTCSVPDSQLWLVTGLENQLVNSHSSDPNVLTALNLADIQDGNMKKAVVKHITDANIKEMTSGKVALYVLALRSSCENPRDIVTSESQIINMVQILEEKTKEEIKHLYNFGTLKTTYYQFSLNVLALCVEESPEAETAAAILAKAALANHFELGGSFSIDTAAVASLALTCVYDKMITTMQLNRLLGAVMEALAIVTQQILSEQQSNGIIGNIYSTGLAMQALSVTPEFYFPEAWDCHKTLDKVLQEVYSGAFNNPAAASQILPSLVGKTYLDVRSPSCSSVTVPTITVEYTVINDLVGPNFKHSITVNVPKDSVLLAVLKAAQHADPKHFSFETEETSWGPMVVSIDGTRANTNEKTYWQYFSGKTPLEQGVGSYKPKNNEHIIAIFSTY